MFELKDLILVVDDILTTEECDTLVKHFEDRKAHSYAEESRNVHTNKSEVTIDKVLQLVPNYAPELFGNHFNIAAEATDKIISKYQNYIDDFKAFWTDGIISRFAYSHEYRLIKYSKGDSLHDHTDKSIYTFGSVTLNLNDGYEGGKFRFFNGQYKVSLKKGQGMIFPASHFFTHGVDEITKGNRYAVNSFLGMHNCVSVKEHIEKFFHPSCEESCRQTMEAKTT